MRKTKEDIEDQIINELAENGTQKARELFLKWQEGRLKATEQFIEMLKSHEPIKDIFPNDHETEVWFEKNIGDKNNCSASSAIHLFRLWLKERQNEG
jgi:hypothetical protein